MTDKDRDDAAEQENSAVNLGNLDVDDAPLSGTPNPQQRDLEGQTTEGEDDTPQPDRSKRPAQE